MTQHRQPWRGLVLLGAVGVAWWVGSVPDAHAQLGVFDMGSSDGGDAGFIEVKKYLSNPWRQDAGPDSGPSWIDKIKKLQGGSTTGFLRERAPNIADMTESDASVMPWGGDGGSSLSSFTLPSFGADIDAGVPDAGPVVAPAVRIARGTDEVTPFTAFRAPSGTSWGRLPLATQARLKTALAGVPRLRFDALTRTQVRAAWEALTEERGWFQGAPAFLLSEVGTPVPARLVVLGILTRPDGPVFYGGFAAPRDGVQPVSPRVVLAASANVGRRPPQLTRPAVAARLRDALDAYARQAPPPFGRDAPPRVGTLRAVVVRMPGTFRVEVQAQEARPPHASSLLCMELTADANGKVLARKDWSPVCDHHPIVAVDADGDGVDEVLWRDGPLRVLRRYPDGPTLDEDPT